MLVASTSKPTPRGAREGNPHMSQEEGTRLTHAPAQSWQTAQILPWTQIVWKIVKANPGPVSAARHSHLLAHASDARQDHNFLEDFQVSLPEVVLHHSRRPPEPFLSTYDSPPNSPLCRYRLTVRCKPRRDPKDGCQFRALPISTGAPVAESSPESLRRRFSPRAAQRDCGVAKGAHEGRSSKPLYRWQLSGNP